MPQGDPADVIHLAIIDRDRLFADAIADRLDAESDIRVLCSVTEAAAFRQALGNSSLDVVVGDAALFDVDGFAAVTGSGPPPRAAGEGDTVAGPGRSTPLILLLADDEDRRKLVPAIEAGVRGWIPRSASLSGLIEAIRCVVGGGTWLPPALLTDVLRELVWTTAGDDPDDVLVASLTPREREVLACLADGLGRREVAERLGMSTNTVRTHVQAILAKLGVTSALAAVAVARRAATPLHVVPTST